jgi:hypothetical protein
MGQRKPRANWQVTQETNANLSTITLAVVNGLTASIAVYPTPPVLPADLQAQLNNYNTALAASIGGSEVQRQTMRVAREILRASLRIDGQYVNTTTWTNIYLGQTYENATLDIVSSGFQLGAQSSPIGPIGQAVIKKWSSPAPGQLYVLVDKLRGARTYTLSWYVTGANPDTAVGEVFPNTRILRVGFQSGINITATVAGNGSSGITTESIPFSQIIT